MPNDVVPLTDEHDTKRRPSGEVSRQGSALLQQGTVNLSSFVRGQARATAELVGFAWLPRPDAPSDYGSLRRAYLASRLTGEPLAVSDEHSEGTIYDGADTNYAFRFWHDVTHVRLGAGFDLDGELAVAVAHLDVLRAAGWGPGTLEYGLLHADTAGQTIFGAATGAFPEEQACFARMCITDSLASAIRVTLLPPGEITNVIDAQP